mmetsp:Transcript_51212/g.132109  ORF Transcript_51212/g.132109 Transcript_51212/m.132109 type:complete len:214 (-) Transcript_51212:1078-1719(-)
MLVSDIMPIFAAVLTFSGTPGRPTTTKGGFPLPVSDVMRVYQKCSSAVVTGASSSNWASCSLKSMSWSSPSLRRNSARCALKSSRSSAARSRATCFCSRSLASSASVTSFFSASIGPGILLLASAMSCSSCFLRLAFALGLPADANAASLLSRVMIWSFTATRLGKSSCSMSFCFSFKALSSWPCRVARISMESCSSFGTWARAVRSLLRAVS